MPEAIARFALTLSVFLLATSHALSAAATSCIVIVGPDREHALVTQVHDELELLGFCVEVTDEQPGELSALAAEHNADAVVRVEEAPTRILVWVRARNERGILEQEFSVTESSGTEPRLLALRAVEHLRGTLVDSPTEQLPDEKPETAEPVKDVEVSRPSKAPEPSAAPTRETRQQRFAETSEQGGRASFAIGPGLLLNPGGLGPSAQIQAAGSWMFASRLGPHLIASFPVSAAEISNAEGSMSVRIAHFGLGMTKLVWRSSSRLSIGVDIGFGAASLTFAGESRAPLISAYDTRWFAMPYSGVALKYEINRLLHLRADVRAGLFLSEAVLRIADQEVAAMGRPLITSALSVEVAP